MEFIVLIRRVLYMNWSRHIHHRHRHHHWHYQLSGEEPAAAAASSEYVPNHLSTYTMRTCQCIVPRFVTWWEYSFPRHVSLVRQYWTLQMTLLQCLICCNHDLMTCRSSSRSIALCETGLCRRQKLSARIVFFISIPLMREVVILPADLQEGVNVLDIK